jgi:hypothetical protein
LHLFLIGLSQELQRRDYPVKPDFQGDENTHKTSAADAGTTPAPPAKQRLQPLSKNLRRPTDALNGKDGAFD